MIHNPFDDPHYARLKLFLEATKGETERGRALVAASLIEEMLNEILRGFLMDNKGTKQLLEEHNAPISSFASKIALCRALGLVTSEEFDDMERVRKIRNSFAHNVMCSFEEPKIFEIAKAMKLGMEELDKLPKGDKGRVDEPKGRYSMVTTAIVLELYNRAHYTRKHRLKDNDWPK